MNGTKVSVAVPEVQSGTTATGNDDAAEVQSAAPVEQSLSTAK